MCTVCKLKLNLNLGGLGFLFDKSVGRSRSRAMADQPTMGRTNGFNSRIRRHYNIRLQNSRATSLSHPQNMFTTVVELLNNYFETVRHL